MTELNSFKTIEEICKNCGQIFTPYINDAWGEFCSVNCYNKFYYKTNRQKILKKQKEWREKNKIKTKRIWESYTTGWKHKKIKKLLPKPDICNICECKNKLELSNKNHKYSKNIDDWQWLCRLCHVRYDVEHNKK